MSYIGTTKIGKMFLGNTEIAKVYLGTDLVFQNGGGPTPPVTTIPYIRGGADGSYIDTGITPDNTTQVVVWARNWNPESGTIFGARIAYGNSQFAIGAHGGVNVGGIRIDYSQGNILVQDAEKYLSHYHKYELYGGVLKVDDVVVGSVTDTTFSSPNNIYLFCLNNNGTVSGTTKPIDICACKIYKNGVLVRDFTAVNSPSVGLFDAVSQTLFTNAGSGSFTYGTFDPKAYIPLEYIECSGHQYFDSGVIASYSMPIICKVVPNSGNTFRELIGYRTSTNCCAIGFGNKTTPDSRVYWRFGTDDTVTYPYDGRKTSQSGNALSIIKNNATVTVYSSTGSQLGTATKSGVATSFQTESSLYVGHIKESSNVPLIGKLYFCGFGNSRNYVPAKVNNVAGMYDTYNDIFYPSMTSTPFIAGPTI